MSHKKNRPENRHHALPKSRNGANEAPNNELIRRDIHDAIHKIFINQHFLEKLDTLVTLDEAVLTDWFRRIIFDILKIDPDDIFISEAFNKGHHIKGKGQRNPNIYNRHA